jgi:hypothetical protein
VASAVADNRRDAQHPAAPSSARHGLCVSLLDTVD